MTTASGMWVQLVTWFLSAGALLLSGYNFYHTRSVSKRLRQDAIRREEFNTTVRRPIENSLADLVSDVPAFRALARSYRSLAEIKQELSNRAEAITQRAERLFDTLERADHAEWASGEDWQACTQNHWDLFLDHVNAGNQPDASYTTVVASIGAAATALKDMEAALRTRMDREVAEHINRQ